MMKKAVFIFSISLLAFSCRDEMLPLGECHDLYGFQPPCSFQVEMLLQSPAYAYPCFNPSNGNEFSFLGYDQEGVEVLRKKTFHQDASTILQQSNGYWSVPDWGKNGWIIYGTSSQVFKVNASTGELVQVTAQPQNFFPMWNDNGDRILFVHQPSGQSQKLAILADVNGAPLDTFFNQDQTVGYNFSRPCAVSSERFAVIPQGVRIFHLLRESPLDKTEEYIFPFLDPYDNLRDVDEIGSTGKVAWCSAAGIFITDLETKVTHQIKQSCDAIQYNNLSVSPDGTKLLAGVSVYEPVTNCQWKQYLQIRIMNIDGSDEEILELE